MLDRQTSSDLENDEDRSGMSGPTMARFALYALIVGATAAGLGMLARRGFSSVNGFLSDSSLVITVLIVGLLGGIVGDRTRWFDR